MKRLVVFSRYFRLLNHFDLGFTCAGSIEKVYSRMPESYTLQLEHLSKAAVCNEYVFGTYHGNLHHHPLDDHVGKHNAYNPNSIYYLGTITTPLVK